MRIEKTRRTVPSDPFSPPIVKCYGGKTPEIGVFSTFGGSPKVPRRPGGPGSRPETFFDELYPMKKTASRYDVAFRYLSLAETMVSYIV